MYSKFGLIEKILGLIKYWDSYKLHFIILHKTKIKDCLANHINYKEK